MGAHDQPGGREERRHTVPSDGTDGGSALTRDLRRSILEIQAHLELLDSPDPATIGVIEQSLDELAQTVADISTLWTDCEIQEESTFPLGVAAHRTWDLVTAERTTLRIESNRLLTADPIALEQLLLSLYENAIEHGHPDQAAADPVVDRPHRLVQLGGDRTPGEIVSVALSAATTDDNDALTITVGTCPGGFFVEDDGVGLPSLQVDRLFEPGFSTTGSAGLGLALVRQYARAHGWSVTATTGSDGGARFEFTDVSPLGDERNR